MEDKDLETKKSAKKKTTSKNSDDVKKKTRKKVEVKEEIIDDFEINEEPKIIIKKDGFNFLEVIIIMFITLVLGFFIGSIATSFSKVKNNSNSVNVKLPNELADFYTTYMDLLENYYEDIDKDKLLDAGIAGMLNFLGDKYSVYMDKEVTEQFEQEVDGEYYGIGAEIKLDLKTEGEKILESHVIINRIFKDSPAEKAGLQVGDEIYKIEDEVVDPLKLNEVASKLKGKAGTNVFVTIKRNGEEKVYEIVRNHVNIESVTGEVKEFNNKKVGYIRITNFAANTTEQFEKVLVDLENQKIDSLIIDVRDNTGGYLSTAQDICSFFLDKTKIIYKLETKGIVENVYSKTSSFKKYPVAVIINKGSASASEILAGALQESYGAEVIGANSYGKGTVQKAYKLKTGGTVKYTIQKWLTPNGNWVNEKGITPSVSVLDDPNTTDDEQLNKALEVITK